MNATEFFLRWNGKFNNFDSIYGAQCVDVIKQYFQDVLGVLPFKGNAIDYWRDIPGFTRIKKTLFNRPQPGDIIVWGTGFNLLGHIGICNWVRTFDFSAFEQNNPIGSPCHYQDHSYKNVLGWLRPNKLPVEAPRPAPDNNSNKVFKCVVVGPLKNDPVVVSAASAVNAKLLEFSNGRLGFEIIDWVEKTIIDPTPGNNFLTDEATTILKGLNLPIQNECDYVLVRYMGQSVWTYTVLFDQVWPVPFTIMPNNWPDIYSSLLFEVGHALIQCYNIRRGSLPALSNADNYSGGDEYVKAKVEAVLPYLYLYDLPANNY